MKWKSVYFGEKYWIVWSDYTMQQAFSFDSVEVDLEWILFLGAPKHTLPFSHIMGHKKTLMWRTNKKWGWYVKIPGIELLWLMDGLVQWFLLWVHGPWESAEEFLELHRPPNGLAWLQKYLHLGFYLLLYF